MPRGFAGIGHRMEAQACKAFGSPRTLRIRRLSSVSLLSGAGEVSARIPDAIYGCTTPSIASVCRTLSGGRSLVMCTHAVWCMYVTSTSSDIMDVLHVLGTRVYILYRLLGDVQVLPLPPR